MKLIAFLIITITSISMQVQAIRSVVDSKKSTADLTYCNPLNLEYCFRPGGKTGREAADPLVVPFKGDYYLFASKSAGYWWSNNLINWNLVESKDNYKYKDDEHQLNGSPENDLPVWGYNPAASVVDGKLIYSQQLDAFYNLTNPKTGAFERVRDRLPISNDEWLFTDDDGRVYLYAVGFTPTRGIYVHELDPKNHLKTLSGPIPCKLKGEIQPLENGDFGINPAHTNAEVTIANKSGEGPQMTKRQGRYYLQVSLSGTEDPVYRDCAFVADSPLGPFEYCKNNPVSYRAAGFANGAGNSGVFADKQKNDWRVVTTCLNGLTGFERRISMYPSGVDRNGGLYTDTYLGDLPQFGPGHRKTGLGGNLVGWMLLSYQKSATASSVLENRPIASAFDENIKTWWSAQTGSKGEWLTVDLGKICRVNALQINFAEQNTTGIKRRVSDELYHQYIIEESQDGITWTLLVDKSTNQRDVPHDYIPLNQASLTRYLRVTNIHMPANGKFAIRDLRIFGNGLGKKTARVKNPIIKIQPKGNMSSGIQARLSWQAVPGATGYVVRYGDSKNNLFHSQDTRKENAVIENLIEGLDYYFVIDSFNEAGITFGTKIIKAEKPEYNNLKLN